MLCGATFGCSYVSIHSAILDHSKGLGEWFQPDGTSLFLQFCNKATASSEFPQEGGGGVGAGVTPCILCKHRLYTFPSVKSSDSTSILIDVIPVHSAYKCGEEEHPETCGEQKWDFLIPPPHPPRPLAVL